MDVSRFICLLLLGKNLFMYEYSQLCLILLLAEKGTGFVHLSHPLLCLQHAPGRVLLLPLGSLGFFDAE